MRQTNLKAVPDNLPEKLSYDETTLLIDAIVTSAPDSADADVLNRLLILMCHVEGYIVADRIYAEGLCVRFREKLYAATITHSATEAQEWAEECRRRLFGKKGERTND
jgi:hypothetical protein